MMTSRPRYIPLGRLRGPARFEAFELAEQLASPEQLVTESQRDAAHARLRELADLVEYRPAATWHDLKVIPIADVAEIGIVPLAPDAREVGNRYTITVNGGPALTWEEYPSRLLPHLDGYRSLAQMAALVREAALAGPDRGMIEMIERESGETFDSYLTDVAFYFAIKLGQVGAVHFKLARGAFKK